jgi:hypothetical protein
MGVGGGIGIGKPLALQGTHTRIQGRNATACPPCVCPCLALGTKTPTCARHHHLRRSQHQARPASTCAHCSGFMGLATLKGYAIAWPVCAVRASPSRVWSSAVPANSAPARPAEPGVGTGGVSWGRRAAAHAGDRTLLISSRTLPHSWTLSAYSRHPVRWASSAYGSPTSGPLRPLCQSRTRAALEQLLRVQQVEALAGAGSE